MTAIEQQLKAIVGRKLKVHPDQVPLDVDLLEEMALDSFDVIGVIVEIEDVFAPIRIAESKAEELKTLRDVATYIDQERGRR
jgi:acyl carrier protein